MLGLASTVGPTGALSGAAEEHAASPIHPETASAQARKHMHLCSPGLDEDEKFSSIQNLTPLSSARSGERGRSLTYANSCDSDVVDLPSMANRTNRRWLLAERPKGTIDDKTFRWVEEPAPVPKGGEEILVRNLYLSADPTQRGWISRDTYLPAVKIGEVVRCFAVGRVEQSHSTAYAEGELVQGLFGWQDYALAPTKGPAAPTKVPAGVPIPLAMSALGLTGVTAYFGLLDVGRPRAGDAVVVSGAAGATGSVVGQIARIKECRAIGIAGGRDKCDWLLREARFDAAIDYKTEDVGARLRELCPKGIDVYFDNVGGPLLDVALGQLAMRGRVVLCGAIATYNDVELPPGPKNYLSLVVKRGRMEGFIVLDYMSRAPEAVMALAGWVSSGQIIDRVDVQEGLENAPRTLRRLFSGENQGKQLLKIADP
jgi:NADPH-dependent curcumin reductase CurA